MGAVVLLYEHEEDIHVLARRIAFQRLTAFEKEYVIAVEERQYLRELLTRLVHQELEIGQFLVPMGLSPFAQTAMFVMERFLEDLYITREYLIAKNAYLLETNPTPEPPA